MQWYKIKDKKPKDDQNVLVFNDEIEGCITHKAYYESETDSFFSLESFHSFPLKVTHWRPLPKLPE